MVRQRLRWCACVAAVLGSAGGVARGDSLVTTDGRTLVGTISTAADGGFVVHTDAGDVAVAKEQCKRAYYDNGAATSTPGSDAMAVRKAADAKQVAGLLKQAETALAGGVYSTARDAFAAAAKVDANNAEAGRGMGYALLRLDKAKEAAKPLDVAARAVPAPTDRTFALAETAAQVAAGNPLRGVKFAAAYLTAHRKEQPVDEEMLDALGIAMSQVNPKTAHQAEFVAADKLYTDLDQKLDETRKHEKRWGTKWIAGWDYDGRMGRWRRAKRDADDRLAELVTAQSNLNAATDAASMSRYGARTAYENARLAANNKAAIDARTRDLASAKSRSDEAARTLSETESPFFPTEVDTDKADFTTAAPPVATPAVAPPKK